MVLDPSSETASSSQDLFPPSPLRLRPPTLLSPYPDSSSPPRSNSVDLSTLRRDIELLSVSSGDSDGGSESEFEPPTPAESIRTTRSRSHDPAAPASVLRRPSRIEHLSELFRFSEKVIIIHEITPCTQFIHSPLFTIACFISLPF